MIDLRLVRQEDAAAYLDFFRAVSAETDNLAASAHL